MSKSTTNVIQKIIQGHTVLQRNRLAKSCQDKLWFLEDSCYPSILSTLKLIDVSSSFTKKKHPPSWGPEKWCISGFTVATGDLLTRRVLPGARARFSFTIFNVTTAGTVTSMPSWHEIDEQNEGSMMHMLFKRWPWRYVMDDHNWMNIYIYIYEHIYSFLFISVHIWYPYHPIPFLHFFHNDFGYSLRKRENCPQSSHLKGLHRGAIGHLKNLRGLEITNSSLMRFHILFIYVAHLIYIYICMCIYLCISYMYYT